MTKTKASEIKVQGFEMLEKVAKRPGKDSTSCAIYVPPNWEMKKVVIIRIE